MILTEELINEIERGTTDVGERFYEEYKKSKKSPENFKQYKEELRNSNIERLNNWVNDKKFELRTNLNDIEDGKKYYEINVRNPGIMVNRSENIKNKDSKDYYGDLVFLVIKDDFEKSIGGKRKYSFKRKNNKKKTYKHRILRRKYRKTRR